MQRNIQATTAAIIIVIVTIVCAQDRPVAQVQSTPARAARPGGEIPSGYVPAPCKPFLRKGPNAAYDLVDCYLSHPSNQNIADKISWSFNDQGTPWAQWPAWAKSDLVNAFKDTVAWYTSGMSDYPGVLVKDPPEVINLAYLMDQNAGSAVYDESTAAWPLYIGHVALSLASEIYAWVPWSLHNLDNEGMAVLFSFDSYFWACDQYGATGFCPAAYSTPANATFVFKFFKTNDLIGATKKETIERVLDWSRRLWHTGCGSLGYETMFEFFQHYGPPPVSRVINGTVTTCASTPTDWQVTPHNWTAGCLGTSAFMATIFRAVNIPVSTAAAGGGHMTPWFISEKLYLSHGDDTYSQDLAPEAPAALIPINEATYQTWFPANDPVEADRNTGRRNYELNLTYPSPWVMNLYCSDIANGRDHAGGRVFNEYFKRFYALADLESAGLWSLLDWKLSTYPCAM